MYNIQQLQYKLVKIIKQLLYNLTINCDFYYIILSLPRRSFDYYNLTIMFSLEILWELTRLYIIFSYILQMNIFSKRLWQSLTCIDTQWNSLALGMAWNLAHFCMPGTHSHFLALTIVPWHSLVIHCIPIICLLPCILTQCFLVLP